MAFSPDGRLLASASGDKTVRLWDPSTGAPCGTLEGHLDYVTAVAFSPDCQILATASGDKTIRLWNIKTQTAIQQIDHEYRGSPFYKDGSRLVLNGKHFDVPSSSSSCSHNSFLDGLYSLDAAGKWVLYKNSKVLRLPYNGLRSFFIRDNYLVMRNPAELTFFQFSKTVAPF